MSTLRIDIGAKTPLHHRVMVLALIVLAPVAVPAINHAMLGGTWPLDAFGVVLGCLVIVALCQDIANPRRTFASAQEAAEWVASEAWRKPH